MTSFFKKKVATKTALPDEYNQPVPGAPIATPTAAAGTVSDAPLPEERRLANPSDPESVMSVRYRPDGTVMPQAEMVPEEDLGPEGMPAASADEAPFSEDQIPSGWNRFPTAEEVAWLNEKYPVNFDDAGNPVTPVPPSTDFTGTITAFTAASPTQVTTDAEDAAALQVGGYVTLEALTGDESAKAMIDGARVAVLSVSPTTLELDLTTVDVVGLTADYVREDAP